MTRKELLEEIEFVRTLAEEGRVAPLLGGAHMVVVGAVTALALATHYVVVTVLAQPAYVGVAWLAYAAVFGVAMALLQRRIAKKPGTTAVSNRVESAVWGAVNAGLFAIAVAAIGRLVLEGDATAPNIIPGAAFAMYGVAQIATAGMSRNAVLRAAGWLSLAIAIIVMLFADAPWVYLLAAGGVLLVLVAPGLALMTKEPRDVV